ncbi:hypothetical protein ACA910_002796 [Epithemia clementina (nom. ined.)]
MTEAEQQEREHQKQEEGSGVNEESSSTAKPGGLSDLHTKLLLRDFEQSGETRQSFDLKGLCDNNTDVYGQPGSQICQQVQLCWGKIKLHSPPAHCRYLKWFEVLKGIKTEAELAAYNKRRQKILQGKMVPTTDDDEASNTVASLASSAGDWLQSDDDEEEEPMPAVASSTKKKILKKKNAAAAPDDVVSSSNNIGMFATLPHPKKAASNLSTQLQPGFGNQHVLGHTSPLFGSFSNTTTPNEFVPVVWYTRQDGTLSNPWIVQVDLSKPDHNLAFDIQAVEGIDQDTMFLRNGFHIRKSVAAPDYDLWEATIPMNFERQWHGRLVLIKGPAQDFWIRSCERYHGAGKVACKATKKAHSATEIAIDNSEDCFWAYYLLVFPPSILLDNQIFSKDEVSVLR